MHSILSFTALLAGIASAAPAGRRESSPDNVSFPLKDGFPNPSQDQILQIQSKADGTLPNGPPPKSLSPDGATNLKLIAFNEIFEVAFFNELLYNVTNKVQGYDLGRGHEYALDAITAIVAQEELHVLNANGALKNFNQDQIQPCKYNFPVADFQSAIALAGTFTDVVLGTLQDVSQIFAQNGDFDLVRAVTSVIGNEGEQAGFFRLVQKKRPSSQPFLTTSVRDFAFTAVQSFTVPGSCPNMSTIPLKTFKPLNVLSKGINATTQNIKFSIAEADAGTKNFDSLSVVYLNAQNLPVVKSFQQPDVKDGVVTFEAAFPFDEFRMNGLTIASVTNGTGPFASAEDVAKAAIFGPGIIEID